MGTGMSMSTRKVTWMMTALKVLAVLLICGLAVYGGLLLGQHRAKGVKRMFGVQDKSDSATKKATKEGTK
jgi:hypothetical protein